MLHVTANGHKLEVSEHTTYDQLAKKMQLKENVMLVQVGINRLKELHKEVLDGEEIEFLDTGSSPGYLTYKRSINLLLCKAVHDILGEEAGRNIVILHSVGNAYYYELDTDEVSFSDESASLIEKRMQELVEEDIPIEKYNMRTEEALEHFEQQKRMDKVNLIKYRRSSRTNMYCLGGYEDYFYGYMVPSTGRLKVFKIEYKKPYLLLRLPKRREPGVLPPLEERPKLLRVLERSKEWSNTMHVAHVGDLNEVITKGQISDLILVQEALQENLLYRIARDITKQGKKIILIAGPSSSGKTTFSHRLAVQLRITGLNPHPIALDDFFKDRMLAPLDENGEYDFESIECLQIDLFNQCMNDLLEGKEVIMPRYNFISGFSEWYEKPMKIEKNDVLIIEGIHGLNDQLTQLLPAKYKYKIYVSALTQLALDQHNRIPTTDGRLIRRIVRDARCRGTDAQSTIARWNSVRAGEEKNIFPFQENADVMFNSAQVYELAVLKQYAEPLLFAVSRDSKEYQEAKRLLKFFDYFLNIRSEEIPRSSILREFIGGGCFQV
ncbi:MAG TPA: nucleoside kinase [Candidatus Fimousia stercorigallinarum]|nr:nucleoside kinase [Candidatus Fimousia stercorigallinarum]